jgi:hypothetical protein
LAICSGDMYRGVPMICPVRVSSSPMAAEASLARPKSMSLGSSPLSASAQRMTFDGLMSRWMTPAWCAASSAQHSRRAMLMARTSSSRPARSASASVGPGTNSITRKVGSPTTRSKKRATLRCSMAAIACASCWKRLRKCASASSSGLSTLIATRRPMDRFSATKTWPMAPLPSVSTSR